MKLLFKLFVSKEFFATLTSVKITCVPVPTIVKNYFTRRWPNFGYMAEFRGITVAVSRSEYLIFSTKVKSLNSTVRRYKDQIFGSAVCSPVPGAYGGVDTKKGKINLPRKKLYDLSQLRKKIKLISALFAKRLKLKNNILCKNRYRYRTVPRF